MSEILFQFTRPRGARLVKAQRLGNVSMFQFTRPRGARHSCGRDNVALGMFQFTRPRGARRSVRCSGPRRADGFNSRAREGRDTVLLVMAGDSERFQFTRPRGARLKRPAAPQQGTPVSIHAPARGATCRGAPRQSSSRFQFTRPRGARPSQRWI